MKSDRSRVILLWMLSTPNGGVRSAGYGIGLTNGWEEFSFPFECFCSCLASDSNGSLRSSFVGHRSEGPVGPSLLSVGRFGRGLLLTVVRALIWCKDLLRSLSELIFLGRRDTVRATFSPLLDDGEESSFGPVRRRMRLGS